LCIHELRRGDRKDHIHQIRWFFQGNRKGQYR
jgi:hypothetical protein